MKSAVETLSPTRAKLTVEVPFEELKPSLDAAYKKIAQQINVPGFRRGKVPPMIIMALGNVLYAIGFGLYGFVSTYWMMLAAMVVITIGEMFVVPVAQTLVSFFAPEEMRGRYMAIFGYAWIIPSAIGPLLAGLIMDKTNPNWVWYGSFILALLSGIGYWGIHRKAGHKFSSQGMITIDTDTA